MSDMLHENDGKFYCPFCSNGFAAEDVLFVDEDKAAPLRPESEYDPQRFEAFTSRVLTMPSITTKDGVISMEMRPMYKYHRWTKPSNAELPYQEPLSVSKEEDSPFPVDITVLRKNGMTPQQLTGETNAPWAVASVKTEQKTEPAKKEALADMLKKAMMGDVSSKQEEQQRSDEIQDQERTLVNMACPHCHSILPSGFGRQNMYRIAMLGGTRSGKTTYMVATTNLLKRQSGLPMGLISSCTISEESERYFEFLIKCLEYNSIGATVLDDGKVTRFVFPIVMNVESVDDDGNAKEFILIINDIPGEAMTDKTFMMNYPGLRLANAAIMLMDPMQFIPEARKYELARDDLKKIKGGEEPKEADIRNHMRDQFTPLPFGETINAVKQMIKQSKFDRLHDFVLVLNKLDLLYAGEHPLIDEKIAKDLSLIHGIYNLGQVGNGNGHENSQHDDGMDMKLISDISNQVVYLLTQRLNFSTYKATIQPVETITGEIRTLCTSVLNWNAGQGNFCRLADENGKTEAQNIIGFRLLEPILYALAQMKLIRTKEHEEELIQEEETGFWARLKRLFHR